MKVVMVNDCAYVGETLIKYLPHEVLVEHVKRSRRFLDKTFGIAWKIFRAKGDIYHVHYLLQDCYLALKFGKHPLIGHAHGSDIRETLKSKRWGWIVKYNLENCDKVLVAQPTILEIAKKHNSTAEYFPIPYDPEIFYPKPLPLEREVKQILLASPHDFKVKGTDRLLHALALVKLPFKVKTIRYGKDAEKAEKLAEELRLSVEFIDKVPHNCMNRLYWEADLILVSFGVGQLDTVAIEAIACGRPVVHYIEKKYFPSCPLRSYMHIEEVQEDIDLLLDRKNAEKRIKKQFDYVCKTHSAKVLVKRLTQVYLQVASK